MSYRTDLVIRSSKNPILTSDSVPYPVSTVHNPAAARLSDSHVVLVFRSHLANGRSILGAADSTDGEQFTVRPEPWLTASKVTPFAEYEEFGVEDPRLTCIEGDWYLTYSAYSQHGVRIGLARVDLMADGPNNVERLGFITQPDHRNTVLLSERIDGDYVRFDRPHTELTPWSIWVSRSPDLVHWGRSVRVHTPAVYHWTSAKVGPGAPPIRTDAGWLHIFHGVYPTMSGSVYRMGVALHDLAHPETVLGISDNWILEPTDPWERSGYVPNVVFLSAAIPAPDANTLRLYWGGADTVVCTGTADIPTLIDACLA